MTPTTRIYYADSYLTEFTGRVVRVEGNRVYLDRTAFYPTSGGQPFDTGVLAGARVVDVIDEEEWIAHVVDGVAPAVGAEVTGAIDWPRRLDHMQQHSGQHLLSAALEGLYGIRTVSFHLGAEASTIDVEAATLTGAQIVALEERANRLIQENRPLGVVYENAAAAEGLRKASGRQGTLRIVTIADLDRSACGGTHVRATGEIGALLIRKTEKIRNTTRIESLCGMRAIRRARAGYNALSAAARVFSAPLDQVPGRVQAQVAKLAESEKARQRLELALETEAGRALYRACEPAANGMRLHVEQAAAMDDCVRERAQAFVEGPRSAYLATCAPGYLLAVSADAGLNAAETVKPLLKKLGGRGGGSATLAQGRVANAEALAELAAAIRTKLQGKTA